MMWKITIYRRDSHTPVVYDYVKHVWWEDNNYIIAQFSEPFEDNSSGSGLGTHHYWTWLREQISHIKEERVEYIRE
jgi:hypothetical protein